MCNMCVPSIVVYHVANVHAFHANCSTHVCTQFEVSQSEQAAAYSGPPTCHKRLLLKWNWKLKYEHLSVEPKWFSWITRTYTTGKFMLNLIYFTCPKRFTQIFLLILTQDEYMLKCNTNTICKQKNIFLQ